MFRIDLHIILFVLRYRVKNIEHKKKILIRVIIQPKTVKLVIIATQYTNNHFFIHSHSEHSCILQITIKPCKKTLVRAITKKQMQV